MRIRVAAGLLLAVVASGAAVSTASAADTSPASGTTAADALQKSGHREGPFSTATECSDRAWAWTDSPLCVATSSRLHHATSHRAPVARQRPAAIALAIKADDVATVRLPQTRPPTDQ